MQDQYCESKIEEVRCHDRNVDPDVTSVVELSEVAEKPTYIIVTSSRSISVENLNFLLLNIHLKHSR